MKRTSPIIAAVFGCISFMNVSRNPRFEAFHAIDIVGLLVSGLCFGVALAGFAMLMRQRRS